jgi:hypothetical protein
MEYESMSTVQNERDPSIKGFCGRQNFSTSFYYQTLKPSGRAPVERRYPNSNKVDITPEAEAAWKVMMAELQQSATIALEAERRRSLAQQAGRIGAASPAHISKKPKKTTTPPTKRRRGRS